MHLKLVKKIGAAFSFYYSILILTQLSNSIDMFCGIWPYINKDNIIPDLFSSSLIWCFTCFPSILWCQTENIIIKTTYSIIKHFFKAIRKVVPDFTLFNCKWVLSLTTHSTQQSCHLIKSFSTVPALCLTGRSCRDE